MDVEVEHHTRITSEYDLFINLSDDDNATSASVSECESEDRMGMYDTIYTNPHMAYAIMPGAMFAITSTIGSIISHMFRYLDKLLFEQPSDDMDRKCN